MPYDDASARYRRLYARLLRLYPKPYRERFGEGMEQTFNDLCRERAVAGDDLFGFSLRTFLETSAGIVRVSFPLLLMRNKNILLLAIGTACILMLAALGNRFVEGWNWDPFDFVFIGALLFGSGLVFELISRRGGPYYRMAVGLGVVTAVLLLWINAAVGIIGSESDVPNLPYFGVLGIGVIGAFLSRLSPRGLWFTMILMAVAQMLVPLFALAFFPDVMSQEPGVIKGFVLNAFFTVLWLGTAHLFKLAVLHRA